VVVVPDCRGQGEEPLQGTDCHPAGRAAAAAFEVQLGGVGLVDGLDQLPQRLEQLGSGPFGFALAGRPQQPDTEVGKLRLEVATVVVLVGQQGRW
jgi:hypothetical protein